MGSSNGFPLEARAMPRQRMGTMLAWYHGDRHPAEKKTADVKTIRLPWFWVSNQTCLESNCELYAMDCTCYLHGYLGWRWSSPPTAGSGQILPARSCVAGWSMGLSSLQLQRWCRQRHGDKWSHLQPWFLAALFRPGIVVDLDSYKLKLSLSISRSPHPETPKSWMVMQIK